MGLMSPALWGNHDAWELAASAASDGLWYFDVACDTVHLSPRALEILGYREGVDPPDSANVKRHVDASDLPALQRAVGQIVRGEVTRADLDLRIITLGGEVRWGHVRIRARQAENGVLSIVAGSLADIDQRKRLELALREESRRDALTGLHNRNALSERLTARIARAANRAGPRFALLYVDLDRFKLINDSLGHATGDTLLLEAAKRLGDLLDAEDMLARVGGDEFVALIDRIGEEQDVVRLADAMHDAMRSLVPLAGRDIFTSLSIGIRISDDTLGKPGDMLRDADVAMYRAKRRGGARTVIFDEYMHRDTIDRMRIQTELAYALRRNELRVAYQPVFDVDEKRLFGFEALVRWQHPTRGLLSAAQFVDEADESGFIVLVGRWMLDEVCAQMASWRREYPNAMPLSVALNASDRELVDPDFTDSVAEALREHDLPPGCLVVEMSESAMVANAEHALPALHRLREIGVQIQMDGFGRGFTSLSVLRRMPLTSIKIDRSFIGGIVEDEEARAMVATINAFARALGLTVVAEGVETAEQAAALAEMGHFRYVQGNHFGRPAAEAVAKGLLVG